MRDRVTIAAWSVALLALSPACEASRSTDDEAASATEPAAYGPPSGGVVKSEFGACDPETGQALFDRRIAPLLADDRPSTCNECHLAGLDLATFVKGTPCETMACMAEQGLVDLDTPEASLVLTWIERADPASELVTQEMIAQEYDAMLEWIDFSASCGEEACGTIVDPCNGGPVYTDCEFDGTQVGRVAFDDPGDCSDATLEAMFAAKVYSWRGRCFPCHFQDDDFEAPKWIRVGECEAAAVESLHDVLERGLVDTAAPASSLLLLKPLAESEGGVEHEGHDKMADVQESAYLDFLEWIERYSACQQP